MGSGGFWPRYLTMDDALTVWQATRRVLLLAQLVLCVLRACMVRVWFGDLTPPWPPSNTMLAP